MTRVAAIDCGTNSIRLLIADVDGSGQMVEHDRRMTVVRLGEGVDANRRFSEAALQRTFEACEKYAAVIAAHEVEKIRFVATSASRDVSNRDEFAEGVRARLNCELDVISGDEEAELSFLGATSGLDHDALGPFLVLDIGGGSTEFVFGTHAPEFARSVNVGCVRMTERHLSEDPPSEEAIALATADIDQAIALAAEVVPITNAKTVVGLAGSVTTVAAMALGLEKYDRDAIHRSVISREAVHTVSRKFLGMTRSARAELPYMHPGRVDVIAAGALVLDRIMHHVPNGSLFISEHDILDGIAIKLAGLTRS
jgi:exopolyphosphatase/guanosine-5'-triphosphate,3'-diphosphate pyrophosphatase